VRRYLTLPFIECAIAKACCVAAIISVLQFGFSSHVLAAEHRQDDFRQAQQQNVNPDPRFQPEATSTATGGTNSPTTSSTGMGSSIAQQIQAVMQSLIQQIQSLTRIAVATPWHWNQRGLGYPRRLTRLPDAATSA
jgi:hypothetical protein